MPVRNVVRGVVGTVAALLGVLAAAPAADAHVEAYGWTNCSWADLTDRGYDVTVSNDPSAPFPADAIYDGHLNSFHQRLADSVNRWASEMASFTNGWMVMEPPSTTSDIRVQYVNLPPSVWGRTYTYLLVVATCSATNLHLAPDRYIDFSQVMIDQRPDWFTQDDSRRAYWEGCDDRGDKVSFTCSRFWDVGSVIMHELGHTQQINHPEDVDLHVGWGPFIATLANCGNGALYHTMCAHPVTGWWSAGRTLDWWDHDSTRRHYEENHYP